LPRAKAGSRAIPLERIKRRPRSHLWLRCFFDFSDAAGAGTRALPSGDADAMGASPFARSRPTSRRGQAKSSARPGGGVSASPLTRVRAASASTAAGGATGRRRQRLTFDQDPLCKRINRHRPRPRTAEQLIGANRGVHQGKDRPGQRTRRERAAVAHE
jgi:hypothetical protein